MLPLLIDTSCSTFIKLVFMHSRRQLAALPQIRCTKVRRSIVGLETLRFCTGNDEKCCTLVYIMSPEIICPNLQ